MRSGVLRHVFHGMRGDVLELLRQGTPPLRWVNLVVLGGSFCLRLFFCLRLLVCRLDLERLCHVLKTHIHILQS